MSDGRPFLQYVPKYLTQDEARAFLGVIRDLRDQVLFSLVYQYGLRVSEVCLLSRRDVDLERGRLLVRRVKGGLWSERPLFRRTEKLLQEYFKGQPRHPDQPLFPGRVGPLKKRQIQALFTRYRDRAGLPKHYTCHSLRHSIATHLLDAGLPLEFVQDHLGHRNIQSTTIYARITDRHRQAVFDRLEGSEWIVQPPSGADSRPRD